MCEMMIPRRYSSSHILVLLVIFALPMPTSSTYCQKKIDPSSIVPKGCLRASEVEVYEDTLYVFAEGSDWSFPFGRLKGDKDMRKAWPPQSVIKKRLVNWYANVTYNQSVHEISYHGSFVKYAREIGDEGIGSGLYSVLYGEVVDREVILASSDIRVGISKKDFFEKYFENVPGEVLSKLNVIKIDSYEGPIHYYVFRNGTLKLIGFNLGIATWYRDLDVRY